MQMDLAVVDSNPVRWQRTPHTRTRNPLSVDDQVNARILSLVADLGNTVLTKRAAGDLFSYSILPQNYG